MTTALIVPWRGGDPDRERAWAWLSTWWATRWPRWDLVMGEAPPGPWCKAAAVADALTRTDADTLVIADADVYVPDGIGDAVAAVVDRSVPWSMPHLRVYRLTAAGTDRLITHGLTPPAARSVPTRAGKPVGPALVVESHKGTAGGGCVVLPRALYGQVPMDPRFLGWGQEDESWGRALTVTVGPPWRLSQPLWHLWHQPAPRQARAVGSAAGLALYRRYRAAATPAQVQALISEFTTGGPTG